MFLIIIKLNQTTEISAAHVCDLFPSVEVEVPLFFGVWFGFLGVVMAQ